MSINVAARLARKKIVKDTAGNIIDWIDETNGGWIIRKGAIVNQERYNEHLQQQEDLKIAARAIAEQTTNPNAPDRTVAPIQAQKIEEQATKVEELDKKVTEMDGKLDAILKALQK